MYCQLISQSFVQQRQIERNKEEEIASVLVRHHDNGNQVLECISIASESINERITL